MKIVFIQSRAHQDTPDYVNEPLGLGYLAAVLIQAGFDDVHIRTALFDDVDETVRLASEARLVGLTATSPMLKDSLKLAEQIKSTNPEVLIVIGGAHATALPEATAAHPQVDFVIRGEGEETLRELATALKDGNTDLCSIRGLTYQHDGVVIHNPDRPLISDIDNVPFPARHLYKLESFLARGEALFGDRGSWIFSSRGCPYQCTYCASNVLWTRRWRTRTPANIFKEIQLLVKDYKVNRINFADDTFTVSSKRVSEVCSLIKSSGLSITWGCNVRVDTVDRELLLEMAASGCTDVWIGAESGSPRILKGLQKIISSEQITQVFKWAREAGLRRRGYFMIGSPEEDLASIAETEKLIDLLDADSISISIFTPYPGCEAFKVSVANGLNPQSLDWSRIDLYEKVLSPTRFLSRKQIEQQHERLLKKYSGIISTRGKTYQESEPVVRTKKQSTVLGIDDAGRWRELIERLPDELNDVYLTPEYGEVFQREGYGLALCFLYQDGDDLFLYPFLKRRIKKVANRTISTPCYDLETPYGYGGPIANSMDGEFLRRAHQSFSGFCCSERIVCEFVRFHPIMRNERFSAEHMHTSFNRPTVYIDVASDEETIWGNYTGTGRNMIRKAKKSGVVIEPSRSPEELRQFVDIYQETMDRVGANRFYFFPFSFFENMRLLFKDSFRLLLARWNGDIVAGAVFLKNDTYCHYHLAGSRRDCLKVAPNNLILHQAVLEAVRGKQKKMHIGGGSSTSQKDSLFRFKANFSPLRTKYSIGTRIHLPELYEQLKQIWQEENQGKAEVLKEVLQIYRF